MEIISFRVEQIDKQTIYRVAEQLGYDSISHFIREAIDQMIARAFLNQELPQLTRKRGPDSRLFRRGL